MVEIEAIGQTQVELPIQMRKEHETFDRQDQQLRITQTFLYVSVFFIIVTLPTSIFMACYSWRVRGDFSNKEMELIKV